MPIEVSWKVYYLYIDQQKVFFLQKTCRSLMSKGSPQSGLLYLEYLGIDFCLQKSLKRSSVYILHWKGILSSLTPAGPSVYRRSLQEFYKQETLRRYRQNIYSVYTRTSKEDIEFLMEQTRTKSSAPRRLLEASWFIENMQKIFWLQKICRRSLCFIKNFRFLAYFPHKCRRSIGDLLNVCGLENAYRRSSIY